MRQLHDSQHSKGIIVSRECEVTNWDDKSIPLELTKWMALGFEKDAKNGSSELFHFRCQAGNLTKNDCAVCQIPCTCNACFDNLDLWWIQQNNSHATLPLRTHDAGIEQVAHHFAGASKGKTGTG
jgi:hypothetical protein